MQNGDTTVSILFGTGDNAYADAVHSTIASPTVLCDVLVGSAQAITSGDIDGDGDIDLAFAHDYWGWNASVKLNNGDGTFGPTIGYGHRMEQFPCNYDQGDIDYPIITNDVALGDLDGDGDPDMVAGGLHLSVMMNNGNGTFADEVAYEESVNFTSLVLADLDGDDDLDVVLAEANIDVYLNDGTGALTFEGTYDAGPTPDSVDVGDVDNDGDLDVVVPNRFGESTPGWDAYTFTLLLNTGSTGPMFETGPSYPADERPLTCSVRGPG